VVALGNHTSSPRYSKMANCKARAGIWRHLSKIKKYKEMGCPSSVSMSSHGTGLGSLSEVVPPPEASLNQMITGCG